MEQTGKKELWQGWRTVQLLGRGGYGEVYEVERDMEGLVPEKAAVKRIPIPQDQREIDRLRARGYQDEEIAEYYKKRLLETLKEYRITAELKGHPNIVGCDDIRYEQQADGIGWDVFVKMELLLPLSRAIDSFTREKQVAKLGKDVLRALIQCEKKGIACSGVKPQNIFLSKSGDCKLGDIGIAKMTDRKGKRFFLKCDGNCTEVLNCVPIYIAPQEYKQLPVNFNIHRFTVENYVENVERTPDFNRFSMLNGKFTRGLYKRGVE